MLQRPNEIKVSVGYRVNGSWKETQQISTGRFKASFIERNSAMDLRNLNIRKWPPNGVQK